MLLDEKYSVRLSDRGSKREKNTISEGFLCGVVLVGAGESRTKALRDGAHGGF